jgi:hypothetical protein
VEQEEEVLVEALWLLRVVQLTQVAEEEQELGVALVKLEVQELLV